MTTEEKYMKEAICQAKKAQALGEVPIGCVIVSGDRIIARGYNRRNTDKNTLSHAELNAIRKASKALGDWRLENCTLYVTLEPCQMCSGAIVQARIPRVVIGSSNPKAGCAGSIINLLQMDAFNHQVEIVRDVLKEECSELMTGFFKDLRKKRREAEGTKPLLKRIREELPGYEIHEITRENPEALYLFYEENPPSGGEETKEQWAEKILTLPKSMESGKRVLLSFRKKGKYLAVADFYQNYPRENEGFLYLFLTAEEIKTKGVGEKIQKHLTKAARTLGMEPAEK